VAFIKIPGWPIEYPSGMKVGNSTASVNSVLIDAAAEKVAWIIQCPKDGTLNRVAFGFGTVGQAPVNGLTVSFQDVNASGDADGTQDQTRAVAQGSVVSNTLLTTGLITSTGADGGVKRVVTQGELLAFVVEFASFAAGDSVNILGTSGAVLSVNSQQFPYNELFTASWTRAAGLPDIALQYSDNIWEPIHGASPASAVVNTAFSSATNPDENGMQFVCPVALRAVGFAGVFRANGTTSSYQLTLYDSSNTVLATTVLDPDVIRSAATGGSASWYFNGVADSVELVAGATYKVTLTATGAGNVNIYGFVPGNATFASATPWGEDAQAISRQDGSGAFTVDSTGIFYALGLLIDAIDPVKGVRFGRGILRGLPPFMRSFLR